MPANYAAPNGFGGDTIARLVMYYGKIYDSFSVKGSSDESH
jgi:hypothetical protein